MMFFKDEMNTSTHEKYCECDPSMCKCGEENAKYEWLWDTSLITNRIHVGNEKLEVSLNHMHSQGTSGIRGTKPFDINRHHYWEFKMLSAVYGTDVMIGVGTKNAELNVEGSFRSLLGKDRESWGLSYKGLIQHDASWKNYSKAFGKGSLVGVHLDTWKGTLQFTLNRKPMGTAFTGLRGKELYPMITSTAAKTKIRITQSISVPNSLQLDCMAKIKCAERDYLIRNFPGLKYFYGSIFASLVRGFRLHDDDDADEEQWDEWDYAILGATLAKRRCTRSPTRFPEWFPQ